MYDLCVCLYDFKILKTFYYTVAKKQAYWASTQTSTFTDKATNETTELLPFSRKVYGNKVVKAKA